MKLFLSEIVNSKESLDKLLMEKLPIKLSYRIQKIYKIILEEFSHYEETRTELITKKYGAETPVGSGDWKVLPQNNKAFMHDLEDLLSLEVELDFIKIQLPETCEISPMDVFRLSWLLDIEDSNKENS